MNEITVVIPVRSGENADITFFSLSHQQGVTFDTIVVFDREQRGANWARNEGFKKVRTPFVLFSDDDIQWEPTALRQLLTVLQAHPHASYSYGAYRMAGLVQCNAQFDARRLRHTNYISTMSLIRTADFPGFDEAIPRLQDWDLWLTMLKQGKTGVYCGSLIFETFVRPGITHGNAITYDEAKAIVRAKHGL